MNSKKENDQEGVYGNNRIKAYQSHASLIYQKLVNQRQHILPTRTNDMKFFSITATSTKFFNYIC